MQEEGEGAQGGPRTGAWRKRVQEGQKDDDYAHTGAHTHTRAVLAMTSTPLKTLQQQNCHAEQPDGTRLLFC